MKDVKKTKKVLKKGKKKYKKAGQPTKYKKKYCKMLIEHMKEGFSFETFSAIIQVNPDTLYEWASKHKEFSVAKVRAFAECQLWWEKAGKAGTTGTLSRLKKRVRDKDGKVVNEEYEPTRFDSRSWNFNMINRFKWKMKTETKVDATVNLFDIAKEVMDEDD